MKWADLDFQPTSIVDVDTGFSTSRVKAWRVTIPGGTILRNAIGVDPGQNYGLAIIDAGQNQIYIEKGYFRDFKVDGGEYIVPAPLVAKWIFDDKFAPYNKLPVAIEDAAYGAKFRQVLLAEIRWSVYLAAIDRQLSPYKIPPATARKQVFGHGHLKGQEMWPTINENAAEALVFALVAAGYNFPEE